jgi:hypothetical protein
MIMIAFSLDRYQAGSYRCVYLLKDTRLGVQRMCSSLHLINLAGRSFVEILPIDLFDSDP